MADLAPRALTRAERQQQTRRALLDAARSVIAQRGIAGASHRDIAAEAGMTIGAIYANFTNKADLVVSVVEDATQDGTLLAPDATSIRACLQDLAHRLVEQADERPELTLLSLEFMLGSLRDPAIRDLRLPHRAAEHASHAALIEQLADRSGEHLPLPAEEFVEVVTALGWALLCVRAMVGGDTISEDFIVRALGLLMPTC
jgi:AcrR family transcriptional regulator